MILLLEESSSPKKNVSMAKTGLVEKVDNMCEQMVNHAVQNLGMFV